MSSSSLSAENRRLDDVRVLYVVMEYPEENLGQILPQRPLSSAEVDQMLAPTVEALSFMHQSGFVHGDIKPSNVMAVDDQLKISADSLRKTGERDKRFAWRLHSTRSGEDRPLPGDGRMVSRCNPGRT